MWRSSGHYQKSMSKSTVESTKVFHKTCMISNMLRYNDLKNDQIFPYHSISVRPSGWVQNHQWISSQLNTRRKIEGNKY
jgi:hypothetical protein